MQTAPTADTPENWDAASRGYADRVAPVMMQAFADAIVRRLDVDTSMEALEVGAGSGALTAALAGRVKSLTAVDFSPKMIALLQERLAERDAANVDCRVMDGQGLEVEDASFDRAAAMFAVMLFPDRAKGFAELRRVLRPGGCAVVSGWAGPDKFEAFGLFLESLRTAFPEMPPPPSPPPVFSLADPTRFKAEMESGGFRDVEVEFVERDLELPDAEAAWRMMTTGAPPVKMLLDRVGTDGQSRLRETLGEVVERRFGGGPIRLTNTATVGKGFA